MRRLCRLFLAGHAPPLCIVPAGRKLHGVNKAAKIPYGGLVKLRRDSERSVTFCWVETIPKPLEAGRQGGLANRLRTLLLGFAQPVGQLANQLLN